jgi:hypothetical protein
MRAHVSGLPPRNVPAGVLYDVVAAPSGELPWRLTLHFRGFPDRQLATYGGEASLRAAFFNSLKEAAVISRGSAQRVMEMAAAAQVLQGGEGSSMQLGEYGSGPSIRAKLRFASKAGASWVKGSVC